MQAARFGVAKPSFLNVACPQCGETKALSQVGRSQYSPVAPQVFGGVIAALVFELSRKQRFHCGNCGVVFSSHTIGSRFWLAVWIFFIAFLGLVLLALILHALVD